MQGERAVMFSKSQIMKDAHSCARTWIKQAWRGETYVELFAVGLRIYWAKAKETKADKINVLKQERMALQCQSLSVRIGGKVRALDLQISELEKQAA